MVPTSDPKRALVIPIILLRGEDEKHPQKCVYGLTRVIVRTTLGSHCGQAVVKIAVLGVLVSRLMEREATIEDFVPCQGCQGFRVLLFC